jgi:hypothetical protein
MDTNILDARVRAHLSHMRPGQEIDARGIARALGGVDPLEADYALERAEKAGLASTSDGRWFGPPGKKSPAKLAREIKEILAKKRSRSSAIVMHARRKMRAPRTTPYRITLTPDERRAIEFASGRYAWPDMLSGHLDEDGAVAFTESEMWQWTDDVDSDDSPFQLASGAFAEKLQHFYDSCI